MRLATNDPANWQRQDEREVCPLFSSDGEKVCLQRPIAGDTLFSGPADGAEMLLLAGSLVADGRSYPDGSWMRFPVGDAPHLVAGARGVTFYLKTGHLKDVVGI